MANLIWIFFKYYFEENTSPMYWEVNSVAYSYHCLLVRKRNSLLEMLSF